MTDETKNLKLFKYNTRTDRKEKFSIDDALNDNWDKVDEAVNANKESIAKVKEEVAGIISPPPIEFESGKFLSNDGNKLVWKEVEAGGASEEELALKEDKANKGVPGGYAGLNARGKVFGSQLDLSSKQDVLVPGEGIKIVGNTISSTVTGGVNNYEDLVGKPTKLSDFVDDLGNTPVHTHSQYENTTNKGVANGYASLGADGKVPAAQLPSIGLNNPYSLFDSKYSDHELNNLSWLKSEGQWNAKAVYPTAYDKLLKVYNGTETVVGLSVKLSTDSDITDYDFVLNTTDETFRLPLLDGSETLPTGEIISQSIPSTGNSYYNIGYNCFVTIRMEECMWCRLWDNTQNRETWTTGSVGHQGKTLFMPKGHQLGVYYGDGTMKMFTFQKAKGNGSLYYYVGETVQNANLMLQRI